MTSESSFEDRMLELAMRGEIGAGARPRLRAWALERSQVENPSPKVFLRQKAPPVYVLSWRQWPIVGASAAAVVAGVTLMLTDSRVGTPASSTTPFSPVQHSSEKTFRPLLMGDGSVLSVEDGIATLAQGWVLVGPVSGAFRVVNGDVIECLSGHAIVVCGDQSPAALSKEAMQSLHGAKHLLSNEEKERMKMIGNANMWRIGAGVSVCVLAGAALVGTTVVIAEDVGTPTANDAIYVVLNAEGLAATVGMTAERFAQADANNDGSVDRLEASETGVNPVNGKSTASLGDAVVTATTTLFDTLDANDDGLLDSIEFSSFENKDGITAECIPADPETDGQ